MLKLIKDSLLIAAVLALVLFLLFIANVIKGSSEPAAPATGGAVISSGSTGVWEFLFIILILIMLYLIYRTFRTSRISYSIPEPTVKSIPVSEVKQVEPKVIAPKMYEPVYRKPLPSPVRQVYVEKPTYVENEHGDRGVHEELSNIRNLLQGKEHDIAKKRFVRLK